MSEPFDDPPTDANLQPIQGQLKCIGSFKAYTQEGEAHVIEIWAQFDGVHDRDRQRVAPTQLMLTTFDGRGIDRISQGEYRLRDSPEVSFSTDDPNAP